MVAKRWRAPDPDRGADAKLAQEIRCSEILARLLRRRGILDREGAGAFLEPKLAQLHDPFTLPDMGRAVDRIEEAIRRREPIGVFGDYDVDGVSATCLLCDFFRFIDYPVRYRLPNRILEGYGLRAEGVRELAAEGVKLIITVDNGSSAVEEVDLARELGVDVVVTDHHQLPPVLPRAVAVVNPWAPGSAYPFKGLAGVGVAFKLVWALSQRFSKQTKISDELRGFLLESLALVALGTISDVVPLVGENRVLAKFGLRALERTTRPGLRRLVDSVLDRDGATRLEASHIGFRLGPRINAAGRLGRAETAIDLLLAEEDGVATELALELEGENRKRQEIERAMFATARELVLSEVDLDRARAIVIGSEGWHAGVIGIVAARIAEEFSRPTLLLALDGGKARGSARSVRGVHICEALASCSRLLTGFGGHEMAAGIEMDPGLLGEFRVALNDAISIDPSEMIPEIDVDADVRLSDLTMETLRELERLAPHGHDNPEPLLTVCDAIIVGQPRVMGDGGKHLSFFVRQDGAALRAVAFHQGALFPRLERPGTRVSLLFSPLISRWQGRAQVELHVRDIRIL